jgi:hypothetical protein
MADKKKGQKPESEIVQQSAGQLLTGYAELLEELKGEQRGKETIHYDAAAQ